MKTNYNNALPAAVILLTILFFFMPLALTARAFGHPEKVNVAKVYGNWLPDKQLRIDLYGITGGNTESLADGLRVRFNEGYSCSTSDDIMKMMNFGENISSYRENLDLVIERRPLISTYDTIYLHFTNANMSNYRFKISTVNFLSCGLVATLQDSYTGYSSNLKLDGSTTDIDFNVTAEPVTSDPFRFRVVFAPSTILPLTLTGFKAAWQGKQVAVYWQVSNQLNMLQYEVERSTNGILFSSVHTEAVAGNNGSSASYSWADVQPLPGNSFYRIRCIGIGGDITLSPVIGIKAGSGMPDISISPNPVSHGSFALQLTAMDKGNYLLRIYNSNGQVLYTRPIDHNGTNTTYAIMPGRSMIPGNYYLQISGTSKAITKQLMVVE